jgi:hypothetical protein
MYSALRFVYHEHVSDDLAKSLVRELGVQCTAARWEKAMQRFELQQLLDLGQWFEAAKRLELRKCECDLWFVVGICKRLWVLLVESSCHILVGVELQW